MSLINKILWGVGGLVIIVVVSIAVFVGFMYFNKSKPTTGTPVAQTQTDQTLQTGTSTNQANTGPVMTDTDKKALSSIGIDPDKIPKTVTKEMEQCFLEKLGAARIQEFATGKVQPTWDDIAKIKPCIQQ